MGTSEPSVRGATLMATPPPVPAMERQLNVVNISLALADSVSESMPETQSHVLFEVRINSEQVGLLEATVNEIGLPLTLAQARSIQSTENTYTVPDHIA